jgi:hypothetical protein
MTEVSVERYVEQVVDGRRYKGYLKIATDVQLDFEIVFGVPIAQLDDMEPAKVENEIRQLFQITIKRETPPTGDGSTNRQSDDANVELTEKEYYFFFSMIFNLVVEFYNNPQTRDNNEGLFGMVLRGENSNVSGSISITRNESYDFSPELCEMLSAPKFGCALIT